MSAGRRCPLRRMSAIERFHCISFIPPLDAPKIVQYLHYSKLENSVNQIFESLLFLDNEADFYRLHVVLKLRVDASK